MAENQVTLNFAPCEPAPVNGYRVSYRPVGSSEAYRIWPENFTTSPAIFVDTDDPRGTSYEGYVQGDCGNDQFGVPVTFTAHNPRDPGPDSGSIGGGSSTDCTAVSIPGGQTLPDAYESVPYSAMIDLDGSAPFTLDDVVKPAWLTIAVVGDQVQLTGTPDDTDAGTGVTISFTVKNCAGSDSADYSDTIDVFALNGSFENLLTSPQRFQINSVTGVGGFIYTIVSGSFPILTGQQMKIVHGNFSGNLGVNVTAPSPGGGTPNRKLEVVKNGIVVQSAAIFAPGGLTTFPGVSMVASDQIIIRIVAV